MFIKTGFDSLKKEGEFAPGDNALIKRYPDFNKIIAVLSDGLGSGIKADILSTMTSKMLAGFAEKGADLIKACETVMDALPVCKVRNISYATFSVIEANDNGRVRILEEGNPDFIWFKNGRQIDAPAKLVRAKTHKERELKVYNLQLELNDILVFVTDGVTEAARGSKRLPGGFGRQGLIDYLTEYLKENPDCTPKALAHQITHAAKSLDEKPHDDTSALVFRAVEPKSALLYTGPPYNDDNDGIWAAGFEKFNGAKAVSGGTTAKILARELQKELLFETADFGQKANGGLPASSYMEGADLVTEGVLTLVRALEYLNENDFENKKDSAGELARFLIEADNINIVAGAKVNIAHYDPNLPVEIELRKNVVKKLAKILKEKYLKKVELQYV